MRTRFLNVDYFNSASIQALETLEFLRLPPPHLPPSNLSNFEDIRCFDDVSDLSVSLDIDRLPIDGALSKFFSDVLPHTINVEFGDLANTQSCLPNSNFDEQRNFSSQRSVEIRISEKEAVVQHEEKKVGSQRNLRSETEFELPKKENETSFDGKGKNSFEVAQFETPELDPFVENACFSEKEDMQIFSEVLEVENIPDMVNPGLTVQYPFEIQESVYSIDDITQKYHIEQKACSLEDDASFGDQCHLYHDAFPLLEVDEISLGIFASISMEDDFLLLENIVPQDWTQKEEIGVDGKELLGYTDIDLLDYLSDHCLSKQCLESKLACSKVFLEMDLLSIIELSYVEGNSTIHPGTLDDNYVSPASLFLFEDLQFLDLNSSQIFEVFPNPQTIDEPEICEQMFTKDMNVKNFDDLIISHELTLLDDSFKSLPVPILSDHEKIRSLHAFVEEMVAELKPQAPSASDGIYLDWHLLEDDKCDLDIYSYWKMFEIDSYSIDSDLKSIDDGMLVLNFVFFGDAPNGPNIEEKKEMLNMPSGDILEVHGRPNEIVSSKLLDDGCQERGNGDVLTNINADSVSSLFQSMSPFNDLDYFLNPHEASIGKNSIPADKASDIKATCPMVSCSDSIAACGTTVAELQQWETKLHQIKLSDDILALIDNFQKSYLAILKNDTELTKRRYSFLDVDDFRFLSLPKEKLMDCIKKASENRTSLGHGDDNGMAFVTLCAIKQMAWYLCYYGIHITYLYAGKLCQNVESYKRRLSSLQTLIEDEHGKANKDITKSHPSLSVIKEILQSNINQGSLRVLIVAEQVFWWPLRRLLTSMKISFNELQNFHTHPSRLDVCHSNKFTDATMDAVLHSDCSFISHEHVSASFPFDKFGIILEYGGSCGSSRVSTISPKLVRFPRLHFLKVELEDPSIPKALCEGVVMPQNFGFTTKGDPNSIATLSEDNQKLEELLNFVPVEQKYSMGSLEAAYEVEACSMPLQVPCVPLTMESKQIRTSMHSFPDTVIIVNTQNFEKEMIISRRSTYQKILAMEKEGAQVVERDLNLPVDVIISAAVCLAWYDCRNIGKKATTPDEASSCLSLCIENIAANVLTSLSFTFSGCIMVFEGESSFLAEILESSDELYAAAASLGIDLQLFCSYSSELTDEIILSCIKNTTKLTRGIYPKMAESETLAESFLTSFPSINPLSAHAILSSGGMLVEFLEWSHEHRIRAIQKYHVPDESVALFSALCRYGEREDSKSGMTDCSSSVSSAPDSENYHCKSDSERKKRKCIGSPHKIDIPMDDLFHFEPLKQFTNGSLNPPGVSNPYESWMSKCPGIFDEIEKPSVSFNDKLFGQKQGSGVAMMMNPSRVCNPYDSQKSGGLEISDKIKNPSLTLNDKLFGQKEGLEMAPMNRLDWGHNNNSENLQDDFIGEVIDINDSSSLGDDFSSIANTIGFSPLVPEMEKLASAGNFRTARKLSFSSSCHPTFPTAAEINSDSNVWISAKHHGKSSREGTNQHSDTDFNNDNLPLKHKMLLEEGLMQKTATNFHRLSFQEKDKSQYGGTPLSNAIRSAQPQQGSPWTIEFLNRIREKSRLRQQSLPCDMSPHCFGYSGNTLKATKRKSPSILDFYRYQGGSTPKKIIEQKRQKRSTQPSSSSKREKTSAPPTWTPTDKRARRTLSFATNGGGGQSELVWSDNNAHRME